MSKNKTKKCLNCQEKMLDKYLVCPSCGYYKYSANEIKKVEKILSLIKNWREKNPLICHNVK